MKRSRKIALWIAAAIFIGVPLALGAGLLVLGRIADSTRLPEALKEPPPALRGGAAPGGEITPTTFTRAELAGVKTTEDYCRLCLKRNPGDAAVSLLLQLLKRYRDEKIEEELERKKFIGWWGEEKYLPGQAEFVREHAGYIAHYRQLARVGPLPRIGFNEALAINEANFRPGDLNQFLWHSNDLLIGLAQVRMREGDYGNARDAMRDALALIEKSSLTPHSILERMTILIEAGTAIQAVTNWAGNPAFPPAVLGELLPDLERFERAVLLREHDTAFLAEDYRLSRARVVAEMERGSWRSATFGWYGDSDLMRKMYFVWNFKIAGQEYYLPRIDRYVVNAFQAIHNRRNIAPALEASDRFHEQELKYYRMSYPDLLAAEARRTTSTQNNFLLGGNPNSTHDLMRKLVIDRPLDHTVRMHLARLWIAWRLDPAGTLKKRGEDFRGNPCHPWRDPFTEQPLKLDDPTSPTMIYSGGPVPTGWDRADGAKLIKKYVGIESTPEERPGISITIR